MRQRDQRFCDVFLEELRTKPQREAILEAGRRLEWGWTRPGTPAKHIRMTDAQIIRRGKKILERDGSVEYLKFVFDAVGFTPLDAARKVVEHATTPTPKDPLGSLEATKLYYKLTTEEQTRKVQVDQRTLVAHKMVGDAPPATRVRVLGPAKKELGA